MKVTCEVTIKKKIFFVAFFCAIFLQILGLHNVKANIRSGADNSDYTVYYVGPCEEFTSITDAVSEAAPGSVIFVKNGIYNESLKIKKNVSIIGESRDGVILEYPCTYYNRPPLEAHCGIFKNMTIRASEDESGYNGTHSYAVHCEKSYSKKGSSILFSNCKFESVGNWDVGMGSCDGFTATFTNCLFNNLGMFYHTYGKYTGQKARSVLNLQDCTFASNSTVTIRNCFADSSVLNVNSFGTIFPTEGYMIIEGSADATGKPFVDSNFKYGARNIIWSQQ